MCLIYGVITHIVFVDVTRVSLVVVAVVVVVLSCCSQYLNTYISPIQGLYSIDCIDICSKQKYYESII